MNLDSQTTQTQSRTQRWLRMSLITAVVAAPTSLLLFNSNSNGPSQLYAQQSATAQNAARDETNPQAIAQAETLSTAFRSVAKIAKPSVVNVTSLVKAKPRRQMSGGGGRFGSQQLPPGLLEEFFGDQFAEQFGQQFGNQNQQQEGSDELQNSGEPVQRGTGSGVIVSPNGYIVTNNHVVQGSDELKVQLSDDREFEAKIIGTDPKSDLAVIKIETTGLVPAKIGNSSIVEVGDWCIAIGSPFGLTQTVTAGIVSATNRADFGITAYDDLIQTDAAINPGNSGGPLLNLKGELIGINTAIASRSGGFNGIGFAIPASMVDRVLQDILKEGRVVRGFLGAGIEDTPETRKDLGIDSSVDGVLISAIGRDGPADKAGIVPGDVVTSINGDKMKNPQQLRRYVAALEPKQTAKFELIHQGQVRSVNVKIEEQSDEKLGSILRADSQEILGMKVSPVTSEIAKQLSLDDEGGVLVEEVSASSPFANGRSAIKPGEVILEVNGNQVSSADELMTALKSAGKQGRLLVASSTSLRLVPFGN